MLFSCLSLNIFAADGDEAVATGAEETVLTEAEIYQQYGVGLAGKYNLSDEEFKKLVKNPLASGELEADTIYNMASKPFGFTVYDWQGMYIAADSNKSNSIVSYSKNQSELDIPILDWVKLADKTENGNTYLNFQRPTAYYCETEFKSDIAKYSVSKRVSIQEAFATTTVEVD
jgi:hypothetical protein